MTCKEGADEAVKEPNPTIDGRRANVNLAYLGAKSRTATLPRMLMNHERKKTKYLISVYSS
jgi:hypothetical protein